MKVSIGCSGWNYYHWKDKFYPKGLAQKNWLEHYSTIFNTVEVNSTFYRFPLDSTVKKWKESAKDGFNFTLKANRAITHYNKLTDVEELVKKFQNTAHHLQEKLSCLLWQLPPSLHRDDEKLIDFCKLLNPKDKNAIEFRHISWFDPEVYKILKKFNVSFCSLSSPRFPEEFIATAKFAYVRFHGKGKKMYNYLYSKEELQVWFDKIIDSDIEEVYIYFNNDMNAHAIENAKQLMEMFGISGTSFKVKI